MGFLELAGVAGLGYGVYRLFKWYKAKGLFS